MSKICVAHSIAYDIITCVAINFKQAHFHYHPTTFFKSTRERHGPQQKHFRNVGKFFFIGVNDDVYFTFNYLA